MYDLIGNDVLHHFYKILKIKVKKDTLPSGPANIIAPISSQCVLVDAPYPSHGSLHVARNLLVIGTF